MTSDDLLVSPERIADQFKAAVRQTEFPCVGAKSALAQGFLTIIHARNIACAWDDLDIHDRLLEWSDKFRDDPTGLRSLVVIFDGPDDLNEQEFESALWQRLQSLADKDQLLGHRYAPRFSGNPVDPNFSISFGGKAYFIVGLHPAASRPARRFARPTMVFNLHDQFARLREEGGYERMRELILARDKALAGSENPMLARHGEASEARQYSGRAVDAAWQCPFRDPRR